MGYSPEEITIDPKGWPERLHREDAARVFAELPPLIEQGGGSVTYRFRHRDGHYIWIQDTFKVIRNDSGQPLELIGAWADITELKNARQRLQYLLAASPAIIYTTKASGGYACTFISENLRAIMGYAPEEMTTDPKRWPELLHPEDAPKVFNQLLPLIAHGGGTVRYRFRHRDGHSSGFKHTLACRLRRGRQSAGARRSLGGDFLSASKPSTTLSRPISSCKRPSGT